MLDLFSKPRRVDDHAVADDRFYSGFQNAGRQQGEFERPAAPDDGVAGVRAAVVADDEVVPVAQQVYDFALGFVAPLQADDTRAGHEGSFGRTVPKSTAIVG